MVCVHRCKGMVKTRHVHRCRANTCVDESSVGMRERHNLVGKPNNVYLAFSLFDRHAADGSCPAHASMRARAGSATRT